MSLPFEAAMAALSEHIYRRSSTSQEVTLQDIGADFAITNPALVQAYSPGLQRDGLGYFYNDATGFLGAIVDYGGKIVVVLRGTDQEGWFSNFDQGDRDSNSRLSAGEYLLQSQLDDAVALVNAAQDFALANGGLEVVVTGQSLGGGLAGLVSVMTGVKGYLFAPAPFDKQLDVEAGVFAAADIVLDPALSGAFTATFLSYGTRADSQ